MRKIILFLGLWSASIVAADLPKIIDPMVSATPPGAKVSAGYFTMINETETDITITGAYSPTISLVEIHLSSIKNDVASMEKQDSVSIEAGGTLAFTHGSYHLMLMELTEPLKENESVDIILSTSQGDMLIEMPVIKPGMHMDSEGHAGMDKDAHADMGKDPNSSMKEGDHSDHMASDMTDKENDMNKDGEAHTEKTKVVQ